VLRTTRGTWTGTSPIEYVYRWFRCEGAGKPDASDCKQISNASNASYVLRKADAGFRIRSQVKATNDDGSATATSNPTAVITSAKPFNTTQPSISGTPVVGNVLKANRGQWGGDNPITYSFVWLRCNDKGDNCSEIQGARTTLSTRSVTATPVARSASASSRGTTAARRPRSAEALVGEGHLHGRRLDQSRGSPAQPAAERRLIGLAR